MDVTNSPGRPPLSRQEGWLSDGRQVLNFQPCRYDRWTQVLEVTLGEVMLSGEPPLLKHRRELMRDEAIKLWGKKRQEGWRACHRRSGARKSHCGPRWRHRCRIGPPAWGYP